MHSPGFGVHSVAKLPRLCRKRRKAIVTNVHWLRQWANNKTTIKSQAFMNWIYTGFHPSHQLPQLHAPFCFLFILPCITLNEMWQCVLFRWWKWWMPNIWMYIYKTRKGCYFEHASLRQHALQISTIIIQCRFNAGPLSQALTNIHSTPGSESLWNFRIIGPTLLKRCFSISCLVK